MIKTLRWKIIFLTEVNKISVGHFLQDVYFMFWFKKNTIENLKFHFLTKICEIQNKR